ncbi:MAG: Dabb family protein [Bilifractor sp.]|jgi:hypothetical protein
MFHCILAKYHAEISGEQKERLLQEIRDLFGGLTEIEGIESVEVFPNVIDRSNRYDVLIRIRMTPEALPVYDDSEIHRAWKRDYGKYLEKKAIFDYEG